MTPGIRQISVVDLKQRLDRGEKPVILDVREPWEVELARGPATVLIPLNEIPLRLKELDAGTEIIAMCKLGGRSQRAAEYLSGQGFPNVSNLTGGIAAWSREIDPSVPAY